MHVRWSDKGGGRRFLAVDEFLPYIQEFLKRLSNCVMVATNAGQVLQLATRRGGGGEILMRSCPSIQ
jgi:hypothetical protein